MKIQINAQTKNGVWGYAVSVWDTAATCVAFEWFETVPASPPNSADSGKETP